MEFFSRLLGSIVSALSFNLVRLWRVYLLALAGLFLLAFAVYHETVAAPAAFPVGATVVIRQHMALPAIASQLADEGVIKRPALFALIVRAEGGATRIEAGPYQFAGPQNLFIVIRRLLSGDSGIPEVRFTLIEGESVRVMANLIAKKFPGITASDFVTAAGPYEGYLFPDTYNFSPASTADQIVAAMRANFDAKLATIQPEINASTHSVSDIIIMASIVEKEANNPTDRRLIAGVLWNRIAKDIALQVDAPFGYLQGRDEYSPSLKDLSIDSPYNTYENKGLPPGPIGNPGLDSIEAAANPTKTTYLFYLTGHDGLTHYATTYAGHVANQKKYLK